MNYDTLEQYKFDETYEKVYKDIKSKKNKRDNFSIEKLQELIDETYFNMETESLKDYNHRDKQIISEATLQAMKQVMREWKNEVEKAP